MPKILITCFACGKEFLSWACWKQRACSPSCSHFVPTEERFWKKVQKTETCWIWTGYLDQDGYGQFRSNNYPILAHRFSWILHRGKIPDGLFVLHHCDNPPCIRPDHLWLGSNLDNIRDAASKGRMVRGVNQHCAKLTEDDVRLIRASYKPGVVSQESLAKTFGVTQLAISAIVRRKTWKHI